MRYDESIGTLDLLVGCDPGWVMDFSCLLSVFTHLVKYTFLSMYASIYQFSTHK